MIKINSNLTNDDIQLLNASAKAALPEGLSVNTDDIHWIVNTLSTLDGTRIPIITGLMYNDDQTVKLAICVKGVIDGDNIQLQRLVIDGENLISPVNFRITPLTEVIILGKIPETGTRKPEAHSQLSACSKLIQDMYIDDDEYSLDKPVPKVFFSMMDMDYYFSKLAVTLEESILLWMESTGRLSVNMNDEDITVSTILQDSIKRIYMSGAARNKVALELTNGTTREFSSINPSVQVELCREILSILPV